MRRHEHSFGAQSAVAAAVEVVHEQANDQPNKKPQPIFHREASHQYETAYDRGDGNPRAGRHTKRARSFRLLFSQNQHGERNENEREQRADVREISERADIKNARGNRLCTRENAPGSSPSRDMANHTRACPS